VPLNWGERGGGWGEQLEGVSRRQWEAPPAYSYRRPDPRSPRQEAQRCPSIQDGAYLNYLHRALAHTHQLADHTKESQRCLLILSGDKNNGGINGRKSCTMTTGSPTNPTIMKTKKKLEKCKYIVEINIWYTIHQP